MTNHPHPDGIKNWPQYLRDFRARHKLTQKALADGLRISKRTVEYWEADKRTPPDYLVFALKYLWPDKELSTTM